MKQFLDKLKLCRVMPKSRTTRSQLQSRVSKKVSQTIDTLTEFPKLQLLLQSYQEHLHRPLQVAVVGEYNAGKSTFLNAILQESVLPTGDLPTTGCVNYIRFGKNSSIVVHYKDGTNESLSANQLQSISTHDHNNPRKQHFLQKLKHIEVFKPAKILEKIVFLDTPGLNAPTKADQEITEKLLNESDAIIWLTSARQVLASTEVDILEAFSERYKGKSLCVISQTDSLNNPRQEVPQLLQYAKETLADYFTDIVAISAVEAIQGNEKAIKPFYTAFFRDIIPRSQEIIEQTVILDISKQLKSNISKLKQELGLAKIQEKAFHQTLLQDVENLRDSFFDELYQLYQNLNYSALNSKFSDSLSTALENDEFHTWKRKLEHYANDRKQSLAAIVNKLNNLFEKCYLQKLKKLKFSFPTEPYVDLPIFPSKGDVGGGVAAGAATGAAIGSVIPVIGTVFGGILGGILGGGINDEENTKQYNREIDRYYEEKKCAYENATLNYLNQCANHIRQSLDEYQHECKRLFDIALDMFPEEPEVINIKEKIEQVKEALSLLQY